jgi:hypothetical protein
MSAFLGSSQSSLSEDTPLLGDDLNPEEAQDGVKQAEAITLVWSRKSLVTAYIL